MNRRKKREEISRMEPYWAALPDYFIMESCPKCAGDSWGFKYGAASARVDVDYWAYWEFDCVYITCDKCGFWYKTKPKDGVMNDNIIIV